MTLQHDAWMREQAEVEDACKDLREYTRAESLRAALVEIADSKSLTATPTQFYQHLQRIARNALSEDAHRYPDA